MNELGIRLREQKANKFLEIALVVKVIEDVRAKIRDLRDSLLYCKVNKMNKEKVMVKKKISQLKKAITVEYKKIKPLSKEFKKLGGHSEFTGWEYIWLLDKKSCEENKQLETYKHYRGSESDFYESIEELENGSLRIIF